MKSLLEMLREQKKATELAIARMNETEKEYQDKMYSSYPFAGTFEERIAFAEDVEKFSSARKTAYAAASRRLTSFGELLGCKVEKKDLEYDYRIASRFHDLEYYCERLEKTFETNVESYNSFK